MWRTWVLFQLQGIELSENISLKMGVKVAASFNMSKNLCWVVYIMSYNQHKLYRNNQKMMDCEWPFGMNFSLILHHNMGMKYAEKPFNMGTICLLFYLRRPSKWLHFQTPNTHILAFVYWRPPPPPPPSGPDAYDEKCHFIYCLHFPSIYWPWPTHAGITWRELFV